VAHCYKCGTETQLYRNNVAVCQTCLALESGNKV
jgi:NMD protein affecting ribosome stability and mRNA decay